MFDTLEQQRFEVAKGRALPLIVTTPERPRALCKNSESISVPAEWGARHLTALPYGTPEWYEYYRHARNEMEGKNRFLKDNLAAAIADPDQRRFRGYAKQLLALLVKIVASNIQTMVAWIDAEDSGAHKVAPKPPGRKKGSGLAEWRPDPTGPPLRIVTPKEAETPAA